MRRVKSDGTPQAAAIPVIDVNAPLTLPRRRWPSSLPAVVAVIFILVACFAAVAQAHGSIRGATTEHFVLQNPGRGPAPEHPASFAVRATQNDLSEVEVVFATYFGTIRCTLDARLTHDGKLVASQTIPCANLKDNQPTRVLAFAPEQHSTGATYELDLSLAPGSVTGPAVWTGAGNQPAVITLYNPGDTGLQRIGTILDRVGTFAPAWGSPAGVVALVLLGAASLVLLIARPRWGLFAVIVFVLVRGLLWAVVLPPLQGMDEGAHFANVQYIAEQHAFPNWNAKPGPYGPYSKSLIVASDAMHVSDAAPTDRPDYGAGARAGLTTADAAAGTGSSGTGPAASYPPGYYAPAALFYLAAPNDTIDQVVAIRLWSVLLGAAAILLVWLFGGELFPGRRWARAGLTAAVALQPMAAQQFAIVNNDALVIVAGFATLWVGARLTRLERAPRLMFLAGTFAGIGMLGKPFAAIVVLPVVIGWLAGKLRYRVRDWRVLLLEPVWAAAGVAATYGVWLAIATAQHINMGLGFTRAAGSGPRDVLTYLATQYDPQFAEFRGLWVNQFWGDFGWVDTPLPQVAYNAIWVFYVLVALATAAWAVVAVVGNRKRTEIQREIDRLILVCVGFGVGGLLSMYAIEYGYFASTGRTDLLQGRYLLMTLPALLALPGLLVRRLSRSPRSGALVLWVVAAGVFVLQCLALAVVVRHYYL